MTGLILQRAPKLGILMLPTAPYVFYASKKLHDHRAWRDLSFERIVRHDNEVPTREPSRSTYCDPDLLLDLNSDTRNSTASMPQRTSRRSSSTSAKARSKKSKHSLLQSSLAE